MARTPVTSVNKVATSLVNKSFIFFLKIRLYHKKRGHSSQKILCLNAPGLYLHAGFFNAYPNTGAF